jgi:hypothetical protein
MLGAYTMGKLCPDCRGDFRHFTGDILKTHLEIQTPPEWLAKLIRMAPAEGDATGAA